MKAPSLKGDLKLLTNNLKVQSFHFLFPFWVSFNYSFTKFGNPSQTTTFSSTSLKFFLIKNQSIKQHKLKHLSKLYVILWGNMWLMMQISKLSVKYKMSRFNSYDCIGKYKSIFNPINNYYEPMYIHIILCWSDWLTNS